MAMNFGLQPVGLPSLVAILVGGLAFFAALVRARIAAGAAGVGERRSGLSRIGIGLQGIGFAITGFGTVSPSLPAGDVAAILGGLFVAAAMAASVALFVAATRAMGANWSLAARMREGHELVTGGVFAYLRHPIYAAMGVFLLALAVGTGHEAHLILGIPSFAAGTWLRVREEERMLRAQFGGDYLAYAARVKRFIPGLV